MRAHTPGSGYWGATGGIARARRCFFIDHIAVHPNFEHDARVCEQLVELAIDRSLEEGFHGWVACIPEEGAESLWKALRFSPSSDRTYRRMGYFV
ncbi:hypothetical protein GCM10025859_05350 [Alicyclobacillus fastidiosus]|nr:hypothetical protein GCM10025859_05350 [Alicyclobacillus fastidiosus]